MPVSLMIIVSRLLVVFPVSAFVCSMTKLERGIHIGAEFMRKTVAPAAFSSDLFKRCTHLFLTVLCRLALLTSCVGRERDQE